MDLFCQSCRLLAQTSHPRKKYGSVTKPAMPWPRPFPRLVALARGNTFLLSAQHGQERCYWGQVATASPLQSMMQAGACVEGIQQCWGIEGLLILGLLSLELPFQLAKLIYLKNCQLKIRQVQRERGGEGRERGSRVNSGHSAHGWSISLMWTSSRSWKVVETEAEKLSRTFERGRWAWSECLKIVPLIYHISVAQGCQAICDIWYQRQEGQGDTVVAAGNLVRTQITCRHWLPMQWVHLLKDSCSIRVISVQLYLIYLTLILELGWLWVLKST